MPKIFNNRRTIGQLVYQYFTELQNMGLNTTPTEIREIITNGGVGPAATFVKHWVEEARMRGVTIVDEGQ